MPKSVLWTAFNCECVYPSILCFNIYYISVSLIMISSSYFLEFSWKNICLYEIHDWLFLNLVVLFLLGSILLKQIKNYKFLDVLRFVQRLSLWRTVTFVYFLNSKRCLLVSFFHKNGVDYNYLSLLSWCHFHQGTHNVCNNLF